MDEMVRMLAADGAVKALAITGGALTDRARRIHETWPVATAALGRTLMAAAMMGWELKGEGHSVTLRIKGGGPLGGITAVAGRDGNPRGYVVNGQVDLPRKAPAKLDVGAAVGTDGSLTVLKDLGLKEPYVGSVPLVSGEIAEDLTAYFAVSEQIPTACALGVLVEPDGSVAVAGGYLVQLLPGAGEETAAALEQAVLALGPVTGVLSRGGGAVALLEALLAGMEPRLLERAPVAYRCPCDRDRVARALVSLGADELGQMIREDGRADLSCQFCDASYHFTADQLEQLLRAAGG